MKMRMRMMHCLLVVLFVAGCLGSGDDHDAQYIEVPIHYPLHINLVFMGFKGDGPYGYELQEKKVLTALRHSLASHIPYSLQSKSPLNIKYQITYDVIVSKDIAKYEAYLRNALTEKPAAFTEGADATVQEYTADIASIEHFFQTYVMKPSENSGTYTIYFVHPNKDQLVGRFSNVQYSYSLNGWGSSQSWVGSGRYMVIDLTAGPVRYGKMDDYTPGVVDYESFPRIIEYFLPEGYQGTSLQGASQIEIEAQISSLVVSAVKHVFASDIHTEQVFSAEKLLVPVIVLRNHNEFNPFEEGINMEIVRHEVQKMALPGQNIQIISANHYIHEHSHISIALSKSLKTDTDIAFNELGQYRPHFRPYIDSKSFAHQLREVSDILGQGLLGNNQYSNDLKSIFFNENLPPNKGSIGAKRSLGTRVLPVYVVSLARYDSKLLLDKYYQVASYNDMVIVLQTPASAAPVPFFAGQSPINVDPKSITKSIVAGLATSLGSITPPTKRFSDTHATEMDEFLWAQGQHPFGHFTNSTTLSQIFVDAVTRNTILAKVHNSVNNLRVSVNSVNRFAKNYFLDPMDIESDRSAEQNLALVDRIKKGTTNFDYQFTQISQLLDTFKIKEALTLAGSLEVGTTKFLDYTQKEIETAENDLICCLAEVSHQFQSPKIDYTLWICMIAAVLFLVALVFRAIQSQLAK